MRQIRSIFLVLLIAAPLPAPAFAAQSSAPRPVDAILSDYVKAVGGEAALDRIKSREIHASLRHVAVTLYWQKPDSVLWLSKPERIGYDGTRGWVLSKKKKVKRLARAAELPVEMDANPLRYVHLKDLYSELNPAPAEEIDGERLEVIVAPNNLAATKLYFSAATHLLRLIEESGETSAYYKSTVEYSEYKEVDGVQFPFRIQHTTTEPGGASKDLRIKDVRQNVELAPEIFSKPLPGQVITGGKR